MSRMNQVYYIIRNSFTLLVRGLALLFAVMLMTFPANLACARDNDFYNMLTLAEKEYLLNSRPLKVVYDSYWPPFEYYDQEKGMVQGINYSILNMVADITGLEFEFVHGLGYAEALDAVTHKNVDMLLSYDTNPEKAKEFNAIVSRTFLSTPIAVVGYGLEITDESILGVSELHPLVVKHLYDAFPNNQIEVYPDISDAYNALTAGEIDFAFENIYAVREAMFTGDYDLFGIMSVLTLHDKFSFLIRDDMPSQLYSIFNKAIAYLDQGEIEEILFNNTSELASSVQTSFFLYVNSDKILVGAVIVLILLILTLVYNLVYQTKMKNKLWKLAYIDNLTTLPNLTYFKQLSNEILANRGKQKYAVQKFDIVKFNTINGVYGMNIGDRILKLIASFAMGDLKEGEICARVGIDSFIILIKIENEEDSEKRTAVFLREINKNLDFQLRFYIGRYVLHDGEADIDTIYEKVTFAHHYARQNSSVSTIFDYDDSARAIELRHREIDSLMEDALLNNDYIVYLQGKYNIHTGNLVGAEALVRWQYADGTPVSLPSEFIPLFETNGFITTLDYYIFENCCMILRSWIDNNITPITISVNFSRLHLQDSNFIQILVTTADRYNIPRHLLEIELTESAMFDNIDTLVTVLAELHAAGFTLSMDDFGAGYSSLGLLKDLPVDVIKLDRSFFVGNRDNLRSHVVLSSIFSMAKSLNIKTLAEGVEYEDQVLLLRALGCEVVQGFYFAKPIRHDQFSFENKPMDF